MQQSAPHHGQRVSHLYATRHLVPCSSKTERQSYPTPPSLTLLLLASPAALRRAAAMAAIAGRQSSSCHYCYRCCCPSASPCLAPRSCRLPPPPLSLAVALPVVRGRRHGRGVPELAAAVARPPWPNSGHVKQRRRFAVVPWCSSTHPLPPASTTAAGNTSTSELLCFRPDEEG